MKNFTIQFEVAVRVRLHIEILTLIPRPQSAVRVLGPIFNTLFTVRVKVRLISGY